MNAEAFTLKARRTTRVPLRVPLQIGTEAGGKTESMDGWTIIVNIHGAKIECKRRVAVGDTVKVTVAPTKKSQSGKVVWSNDTANTAGNYEFAVELTEPGNLWGVGFPPSDWKEVRTTAGPVAVESRVSGSVEATQPPPAAITTTEAAEPASIPVTAKKINVVGYELKPIVPFAVPKLGGTDAPIKEPVPVAQLTAPPVVEAPAIKAEHKEPTAERPIEEVDVALPDLPLMAEPYQPGVDLKEMSTDATGLETSMNVEKPQSPNSGSDDSPAFSAPTSMEQLFATPSDTPLELDLQAQSGDPEALQVGVIQGDMKSIEAEIALEHVEISTVADSSVLDFSVESVPVLEMPSPIPNPILDSVAKSHSATPESTSSRADASSFTAQCDLIESALQAKIEAMIEGAAGRFESALSGMEGSAIERVDKRLGGTVEDHYERLDQHSESLIASCSLSFEQTLVRLSDAAEQTARNRQQELVSRMDQDLRRRAADLTTYTEAQLQRNATEAAENAQSAMAAKLQDLLAGIDEEVGEKYLLQAEQIHKMNRAQFEGMLSSRIEDARAYWQGQLDEMQVAASKSVADSLEAYTGMQSKKLMQQVDQALAQMAGQIQKTFFKHVVAELSSQQEAWMRQLRREMENLSDQGVLQIRHQLAEVLGEMGKALVASSPQPRFEPAPSTVIVESIESDQLIHAGA